MVIGCYMWLYVVIGGFTWLYRGVCMVIGGFNPLPPIGNSLIKQRVY